MRYGERPFGFEVFGWLVFVVWEKKKKGCEA